MSGMGKTYRSRQLEMQGFTRYCSDHYIETRLDSLPGMGIECVAEWMGQPYEARHWQHCIEYLTLEERSIITFLKECGAANAVIDTTGSVIYLSPDILDRMKQQTLIVYLKASQEVKDELFHIYMTDPKPVVWGDSFYKLPSEPAIDALKRCYPELLEFRAARYTALADVTLPYEIARDEQSMRDKFLQKIRKRLS